MAGSKKQVFYIHGGDAFTDYDKFLQYLINIPVRDLPDSTKIVRWSRTIADALGDEYEVFAPEMPNKINAKYEEWKIWFERYHKHLHDGAVLMGWSLGGYFLAKYLVENDTPFKVKALLLLAPLFENNDNDPDGEDGGDFSFDVNMVSELSKKAENIILMHSKDDPIVPFEHSKKYAKALPEAEFITFEDKNHFLIEEFPELINKIKALT